VYTGLSSNSVVTAVLLSNDERIIIDLESGSKIPVSEWIDWRTPQKILSKH
jgi:hypothetical protein